MGETDKGAWTAGPWRYTDGGYVEVGNAPLKARSGWHDYAYGMREDQAEWDANARLIAAAPELYEALSEAEDHISAAMWANAPQTLPAETIRKMRAALAKALGK